MAVKRQHYVPRVYLKNWETRVCSKKEPNKYFHGIYFYKNNDLETGDGKNKDSVLSESRLYNVNYELSFILPSCPIIEKDYIKQVNYKLSLRRVNAYYEGKLLRTKKDLVKCFFYIDDWQFRYKDHSKGLARKKAILNDIKGINSYVLENTLDDVVEKKWQKLLEDFIHQMETTIPLNGVDEIRRIDYGTVIEIVKMVIFLMCRNPDFDYLGILPKIMDIFTSPLYDIVGPVNQDKADELLQKQREGVWLKELYNALFDVPKGYFHTLKSTVQNSLQIILFKVYENQGSFITSDKPAFVHISSVESTNFNSIICPLTPRYLIMIAKGDNHSLNDVNFREANNDLIKRFNRIILNHANNAIVSDCKHLGYII